MILVENAKPEVIIEALNRARVSEEEYKEIYKSEICLILSEQDMDIQ